MSEPSEGRRNFETWFGAVLEELTENRDAGFAITMVVFPLLERYLVQKSGGKANSDPFNQALLGAFPPLLTIQRANRFWSIFRHGLLHNVALSKESHGLSHDKPMVEIDADGKVWLNPNLFAEKVLEIIRSDFSTYEKGVPLPTVSPIYGAVPAPGEHSAYWGTSRPRGTGK